MKMLNPPTAPQPISSYSQGIEVAGPGRTLFISGQVAVTPDGRTVGSDFRAQAAQVWGNVAAMLKAAGMSVANLVHVTTYLTDAGDVGVAREERNKVVGNHRPASTMVIVSALVSPDWRIEVEAIAFKPAPAARAARRVKPAARKKSRRR